jgi:hypothetical protein
MKTFQRNLGLLSAIVLSSLSLTASANSYDLTFTASTPDGTVADAQITVVNGTATSGTIDLTTGPDAGDYTLVTSGLESGSGDDNIFTYDNLVTPGSDNGYLDSTGGLLFSVSGNAGDSTEINMWYNSSDVGYGPAGSYAMWGYDGGYNLESYGTSTLVPAHSVNFGAASVASAADGGWTGGLLFGALAGLQALRRKLTK